MKVFGVSIHEHAVLIIDKMEPWLAEKLAKAFEALCALALEA